MSLFLLGLGALASQIPSLDPFRWPGYYLIIHGGLLNIFVMLFFSEKWNDINRKERKEENSKRKWFKFQKPDQPIQVSIGTYMHYCVYYCRCTICVNNMLE